MEVTNFIFITEWIAGHSLGTMLVKCKYQDEWGGNLLLLCKRFIILFVHVPASWHNRDCASSQSYTLPQKKRRFLKVAFLLGKSVAEKDSKNSQTGLLLAIGVKRLVFAAHT